LVEGWLNLAKFITSQFGLPGSLAVGIAGYLIYLLQKERESHEVTRQKVLEAAEKRVELSKITTEAVLELRQSLQAVAAILGKK
jgi:hypothetical protein